jgi:hypothetical protein
MWDEEDGFYYDLLRAWTACNSTAKKKRRCPELPVT